MYEDEDVWAVNRRRCRAELCLLIVVLATVLSCRSENQAQQDSERIVLPSPEVDGAMTVEAAIQARRSVRSFAPEVLSMEQMGQLAWAAQGVTDPGRNLRTAPSAGATYPMELYLVSAQGMYRYRAEGHQLLQIAETDLRAPLASAALGQSSVSAAPVVVVITAVFERTARSYGDRAARYVYIEAGHIAQNIHLQAVAMGLGSVPVGAFDDAQVAEVLDLPDDHEPVYLIPVGRPE